MPFDPAFKSAVLPEPTFQELFAPSERAAVLVGAAMVDDALRRTIETVVSPCDKDNDPLFDEATSPLGSFSAKTLMAERLRLISSDIRQARLADS